MADHHVVAIRARLVTPVVESLRGGLNLDGALSAAVSHRFGWCHDVHTARAVIPIPVRLLWVLPDGWPLWACTRLMPVAPHAQAARYWHGRWPAESWRALRPSRAGAPGKIDQKAGRWKDYRVPLAAMACETWEALAVAPADALRDLLNQVLWLGKKNSQGLGRVAAWGVQPRPDLTPDQALPRILANRPVPVAALADLGQPPPRGATAAHMGWTPPYWDSDRWAEVVHVPG